MFSSCPVVALVDGVKIGSGKGSDSRKPAGKVMPETLPVALYSFQAEPEMYPRTMHSTGKISALRTSIERPRNWSAYLRAAAGYLLTSAVIRWFGTTSARKSNQNREI